MPGCVGTLTPSTCETCAETSCCAEASACYADQACTDCVVATANDPSECKAGTTPRFDTLNQCLKTKCATQCPAPPVLACDAPSVSPSMGSCYALPMGGCNPVTNAGCAGGMCDIDVIAMSFTCFNQASTGAICAECNFVAECAGGSTCVGSNGQQQCAKFCCADTDCGSGHCNKTMTTPDPNVGICVAG
jgi:hypothetical protein